MATSLRNRIIRLAYENKELRPHLLRILASCEDLDRLAGRRWGGPGADAIPDDNLPYNKHPDSPPAGEDNSPQRKKYNDWFRENVCPKHKTQCGLNKKK